jgi:RNA polymerase sigma-70 factor (ECF subfamily)
MAHSTSKRRDRGWAERIRRGDREAFEALFRAYADDLCGFAACHVGEGAAEDVVQDVFCDLWNRRADWYPQASVKAYLFGAVRNTAHDHLEHRRVKRAWEAEEKKQVRMSLPESPADVLQHHELKRAMRQAVEALPERRRLVYRMVRQQGMSYAETAEVLDIAPKTVENQMGRALKTLRERLSKFASTLQ